MTRKQILLDNVTTSTSLKQKLLSLVEYLPSQDIKIKHGINKRNDIIKEENMISWRQNSKIVLRGIFLEVDITDIDTDLKEEDCIVQLIITVVLASPKFRYLNLKLHPNGASSKSPFETLSNPAKF